MLSDSRGFRRLPLPRTVPALLRPSLQGCTCRSSPVRPSLLRAVPVRHLHTCCTWTCVDTFRRKEPCRMPSPPILARSFFFLVEKKLCLRGKQAWATVRRGSQDVERLPTVARDPRTPGSFDLFVPRRLSIARPCVRRPNSSVADGSARPSGPTLERGQTAYPFRFRFPSPPGLDWTWFGSGFVLKG